MKNISEPDLTCNIFLCGESQRGNAFDRALR